MAFRRNAGTLVSVYVSNLPEVALDSSQVQYCKFGAYVVQA
eukprot:CAMPEP_0170559108 /NCGR_PEP_ID=MMETSP0211-20121228/40085_1 /TAXON_ID=311385 /ORGANISM="Pseudokeronopsis sp., Strain OXSARD2" /LENGTH=40 /DNA_ID= /DNA_START= /DNA_END= /DNA_ORIENTATION=